MSRFLSVIGTRPQYCKVLDLKDHVVCDSRQHYDKNMSEIFAKELRLKPKYNLNARGLGNIYEKLVPVIQRENPDVVIVYGDTFTTLAGALAAKFCGKILAHVESGMRSGDMKQPEEVIRILVDRVSDYRFCANEYARMNLGSEGIYENVFVVGDPMWDALSKVLPVKKTKEYGTYNLLTLHRPATVDKKEPLKEIFEALEESGEKFIIPLHPRTKENIKKFKLKIPKNIEVIEPQGYKQMIQLETNAKKILTDSGGVTREGYWFSKPVIILRYETEWREIVEDGWGVLVGHSKQLILNALKTHNPKHPPRYVPEFGAKVKIAELLIG